MTKKVDIRLLQEAQAAIEQLQAKLSGKSFVSHEHYAALQLERDQLAARVGELERAIRSSEQQFPAWHPVRAQRLFERVLRRSKPASLARHDAEVFRKAANIVKSWPSHSSPERELLKEAGRIEQEADK